MVAGLLMTAGLPPWPMTGALVPLGMALLFVVLVRCEHPGRTAWIFALVHQSSLLYWLFLLDPAKSIPTRALVPLQAAAAIAYVSVFYLGLGWLLGHLRRWIRGPRALLLMPVLWTAMEAARAWGELAFSWCLSGAAVVDTPLAILARGSGEIGVGSSLAFLAAALSGLWYWRFGGGDRRVMLVLASGAGLVWVLLIVGAGVRPSAPAAGSENLLAKPLEVAAIQADVALADKWDDAKIDSTKVPYEVLTGRAAAGGAKLVIWAETAIPAYLRFEKPLLNWTRRIVRDHGVFLYTGFPDAERAPDGAVRRYNSSGLFEPGGGLVERYAKYHLLPIGEAMPFQALLPALAKVDVGQAEWVPGEAPTPLVVATPEGDFPFSGLICFESIFSSLARKSVLAGSRCLVVITNDGWFGRTAGPRQHAALARLRAAECDVPVIRSANNGISFVCDAEGRLQGELGLGRRGFVQAPVVLGGGRTLYVRYGAWPLFWLLIVWTLLLPLWLRWFDAADLEAAM